MNRSQQIAGRAALLPATMVRKTQERVAKHDLQAQSSHATNSMPADPCDLACCKGSEFFRNPWHLLSSPPKIIGFDDVGRSKVGLIEMPLQRGKGEKQHSSEVLLAETEGFAYILQAAAWLASQALRIPRAMFAGTSLAPPKKNAHSSERAF